MWLSHNDVISSHHPAEEEYKPEEADLFLSMDQFKGLDGELTPPFITQGFGKPLPHLLQRWNPTPDSTLGYFLVEQFWNYPLTLS